LVHAISGALSLFHLGVGPPAFAFRFSRVRSLLWQFDAEEVGVVAERRFVAAAGEVTAEGAGAVALVFDGVPKRGSAVGFRVPNEADGAFGFAEIVPILTEMIVEAGAEQLAALGADDGVEALLQGLAPGGDVAGETRDVIGNAGGERTVRFLRARGW